MHISESGTEGGSVGRRHLTVVRSGGTSTAPSHGSGKARLSAVKGIPVGGEVQASELVSRTGGDALRVVVPDCSLVLGRQTADALMAVLRSALVSEAPHDVSEYGVRP